MRIPKPHLTLSVLLLLCFLFGVSPGNASWTPKNTPPVAAIRSSTTGARKVFLPLLNDWVSPASASRPGINAPYFSGNISYNRMAIAWFGAVDTRQNYADIRVGYNDTELYVNLSVFDRYLWYDTTPSSDSLSQWDAVSVYVDMDGNQAISPGTNAYRIVAQLNWGNFEPRENFQAAYRGNGSGWSPVSINYSTTTGWQGRSPNNNSDEDRGWVARIHIPFSSLGASAPPPAGTVWGLAVVLHDRDNSSSAPLPVKTWPKAADSARPRSWGQVRFGLPVYQAPPSKVGGTTMIRQGENNALVIDGEVGGGSICGHGFDFWTEWGDTPTPGGDSNSDFNIQNQGNVADWPCFSKVFLTFPLDSVPAGKVIRSAKLVLHEFGGSDFTQANGSWIQVLTIAEDWDESSLTWNNAPYALQNISATWVDPYPSPSPNWPGNAYDWDVSLAAAQAYASRGKLRLALYSADSELHSGKYFTASHTGDWNKVGRPTLIIEWGTP